QRQALQRPRLSSEQICGTCGSLCSRIAFLPNDSAFSGASMKIVRYLDSREQVKFATQQADGTAQQIDGDIFGEVNVSGRRAYVKKLLAPVVPAALLCIGLNYRRHAAEGGSKVPEFPVLFMKSTSSLQNPGDPI